MSQPSTTKRISFLITEEMSVELQKILENTGLGQSQFCRIAIAEKLQSMGVMSDLGKIQSGRPWPKDDKNDENSE